jgi:hypothetical protein
MLRHVLQQAAVGHRQRSHASDRRGVDSVTLRPPHGSSALDSIDTQARATASTHVVCYLLEELPTASLSHVGNDATRLGRDLRAHSWARMPLTLLANGTRAYRGLRCRFRQLNLPPFVGRAPAAGHGQDTQQATVPGRAAAALPGARLGRGVVQTLREFRHIHLRRGAPRGVLARYSVRRTRAGQPRARGGRRITPDGRVSAAVHAAFRGRAGVRPREHTSTWPARTSRAPWAATDGRSAAAAQRQ